MVCVLFHRGSSQARGDEAAMKSSRSSALFTQVRRGDVLRISPRKFRKNSSFGGCIDLRPVPLLGHQVFPSEVDHVVFEAYPAEYLRRVSESHDPRSTPRRHPVRGAHSSPNPVFFENSVRLTTTIRRGPS
jgi:hypothetical protein